MKIHSDILTESDIHAATCAAGMRGVDADVITRGSRSRKRSLDMKLTGTSTRRPNPGTGSRGYSDDYAATWDEWGMVINALFDIDPKAIIGQYPSAAHFHAATRTRFENLTAPYQHGNHKFEYEGGIMACKFCEATFDRTALIEAVVPA